MTGGSDDRTGKPLSAAFVKSVTRVGKHHDNQGTGLYLRVDPSGAKFWVQRVTMRGRRREIGLGSPPVVGLGDARAEALENKRAIRAGRDPIADKRAARAVLTFAEAAKKAHAELSPTWKNPKDRAAFLTTLETYIFPRFGRMPLPEVTSADIRRAILAVREKRHEVARKLVFRVSAVFKWGVAEGMCTTNPATADALALPRVEKKPEHRKFVPHADLKACLDKVKASGAGPATKLALAFVVLTATRSGETRLARWEEFDLHGAAWIGEAERVTWEIPADRMKMKRPHRVPLSDGAIAILLQAESLRDASGLVFPGTKPGRPLSDATLLKLLRELGFDASVHGFRTSFRTWAQEKTTFPREVAEAALAHLSGDAVERAYARSDVFFIRCKMMQAWAEYLRECN